MKKNKNLNDNLEQQNALEANLAVSAAPPAGTAQNTDYIQNNDITNNNETKDKPKKKSNGKIVGLTIFQSFLFALSFPVLAVVSLIFSLKMYEMVPYYGFWPFVGAILVGAMALIFFIVALVVTRKKSKRSLRYQTVALLVTVLCCTAGLGVLLDTAAPDIIASATSYTLFVEDIYNTAQEQADYNAGMVREFARLNILNGNYDPEYAYAHLSAKNRSGYLDEKIESSYKKYSIYSSKVLNDLTGLKAELYDFIYNKYVKLDYTYAFDLLRFALEDSKGNEVEGLLIRQAFALALTDRILPVYEKLCKEGMSNQRLAYIFNNNYLSMDQDGYVTFDDALLLYATDNRMTIPVIIRLLLNMGHTYTDYDTDPSAIPGKLADEAMAKIVNGKVVEPEGAYFFELYSPEAVLNYYNKNQIEWADDGIHGVTPEGYVVIATFDKDGDIIGGYLRKPMKWSVLDMDGNNMDIASLDIGGLLSGLGSDGIAGMIMDMIKGMLGEGLEGLLNTFSGEIELLLDKNLSTVVMSATGGAVLNINLYADDSGVLNITAAPTNVERGLLGYQYMTWLQSNSLLFAVISVYSVRNWLYIFGAVSIVLVLAVSLCREAKRKIKEKEAAAAGGEGGEPVNAAMKQ